jgi:ABC-type multidrug transport system ATPase subunit
VSGLAVATEGLTKRYGTATAVSDLDLAVPTGSVFGFLGPNGSGKTTTIRMMLGLATPTAGRVLLLGEPMPAALSTVLPRVGALVEGPAHYPFLSGRANLVRLDAASGGRRSGRQTRVDDALQRVGLGPAATKKVSAYSLGMKQRLGLAAALLRRRDLLVLDEPTNGLDPQGTREVRGLVRELAADGATVFLSSHLLAEVDQLCTHAAVMSAGRLVVQGALGDIRVAADRRIRIGTPDVAEALRTLERLGLGEPVRSGAELVEAVLGRTDPADVTAELVRRGVRVRSVGDAGGTLEDVFVALTGEGFEVAG